MIVCVFCNDITLKSKASMSWDDNQWRNWSLFRTHLVSSLVFSLDCRIVALWRWGWGSVFDTETCCSWGRVCACWRSAGWPAGPSLPCAAGSVSWLGRPSCCAQLTQGVRRASTSRRAAQPPRMMDRDGQRSTARKIQFKEKSLEGGGCYWCWRYWLGCWCRVSEVTLIRQCRTSSVTVSYYQSHVTVERAKHWQSMLLSSSVLSVSLVCCPVPAPHAQRNLKRILQLNISSRCYQALTAMNIALVRI